MDSSASPPTLQNSVAAQASLLTPPLPSDIATAEARLIVATAQEKVFHDELADATQQLHTLRRVEKETNVCLCHLRKLPDVLSTGTAAGV